MVSWAVLLCLFGGQFNEHLPVEVPVLPQYYRPTTQGPSVSEITVRVRVASKSPGQEGVVELPVPSQFSGQTIVSFRVQSEPANAMKFWQMRRREEGENTYLRVNLEPFNGETVVSYSARVIVPGFEVNRTQKKDFDSFLGPTPLVQSDDPKIIALATQLKQGNPSRTDLVGRALKWVAKNRTGDVHGTGKCDALSALRSGGDSLGRANLCTAILRASGIPARTVAYIPTWAENMDAEWWLTQHESEDGNWDNVDPTVGIQFPARNALIVLAITSRADENPTGAYGALRPGAPTMSTPDLSPGFKWVHQRGDPPAITTHLIQTFSWQSGARLMGGAFRRCQKVVAAAEEGKSMWLDDAQFKEALSKGSANLAPVPRRPSNYAKCETLISSSTRPQRQTIY